MVDPITAALRTLENAYDTVADTLVSEPTPNSGSGGIASDTLAGLADVADSVEGAFNFIAGFGDGFRDAADKISGVKELNVIEGALRFVADLLTGFFGLFVGLFGWLEGLFRFGSGLTGTETIAFLLGFLLVLLGLLALATNVFTFQFLAFPLFAQKARNHILLILTGSLFIMWTAYTIIGGILTFATGAVMLGYLAGYTNESGYLVPGFALTVAGVLMTIGTPAVVGVAVWDPVMYTMAVGAPLTIYEGVQYAEKRGNRVVTNDGSLLGGLTE